MNPFKFIILLTLCFDLVLASENHYLAPKSEVDVVLAEPEENISTQTGHIASPAGKDLDLVSYQSDFSFESYLYHSSNFEKPVTRFLYDLLQGDLLDIEYVYSNVQGPETYKLGRGQPGRFKINSRRIKKKLKSLLAGYPEYEVLFNVGDILESIQPNDDLWLSVDLIGHYYQYDVRYGTNLVAEYFFHELFCNTSNHYEIMKLQFRLFPENYPNVDLKEYFNKLDKRKGQSDELKFGESRSPLQGALKQVTRDFINQKADLLKDVRSTDESDLRLLNTGNDITIVMERGERIKIFDQQSQKVIAELKILKNGELILIDKRPLLMRGKIFSARSKIKKGKRNGKKLYISNDNWIEVRRDDRGLVYVQNYSDKLIPKAGRFVDGQMQYFADNQPVILKKQGVFKEMLNLNGDSLIELSQGQTLWIKRRIHSISIEVYHSQDGYLVIRTQDNKIHYLQPKDSIDIKLSSENIIEVYWLETGQVLLKNVEYNDNAGFLRAGWDRLNNKFADRMKNSFGFHSVSVDKGESGRLGKYLRWKSLLESGRSPLDILQEFPGQFYQPPNEIWTSLGLISNSISESMKNQILEDLMHLHFEIAYQDKVLLSLFQALGRLFYHNPDKFKINWARIYIFLRIHPNNLYKNNGRLLKEIFEAFEEDDLQRLDRLRLNMASLDNLHQPMTDEEEISFHPFIFLGRYQEVLGSSYVAIMRKYFNALETIGEINSNTAEKQFKELFEKEFLLMLEKIDLKKFDESKFKLISSIFDSSDFINELLEKVRFVNSFFEGEVDLELLEFIFSNPEAKQLMVALNVVGGRFETDYHANGTALITLLEDYQEKLSTVIYNESFADRFVKAARFLERNFKDNLLGIDRFKFALELAGKDIDHDHIIFVYNQLNRDKKPKSPPDFNAWLRKVLSYYQHGIIPTRNILESGYSFEQLQGFFAVFRQGRFDRTNPLHLDLGYSQLVRDLKGLGQRVPTFQEYLNEVKNEKKLEDVVLHEKHRAELVYLAWEAYVMLKKIKEVSYLAFFQKKKVIVIENLSYGGMALAPIKKLLKNLGIEVWSARQGSSISHRNPDVLHHDLFTDEQLERLVKEQPYVIVVDGSYSLDSEKMKQFDRRSPRYPDARQGYANYFARLSAALFDLDPSKVQEDFGLLYPLGYVSKSRWGRFRDRLGGFNQEHKQLAEKVRVLRDKVDLTQLEPYKMFYWYGGDIQLRISEQRTERDLDNRYLLSDDRAQLESQMEGPRLIFFQSALEPDIIPNRIRALAHGEPHSPAYFDDRKNFSSFSWGFTPYGPRASREYADYAENVFHMINTAEGRKLKNGSLNEELEYPLLMLDLDGTLARTRKPIQEDMIKEVVRLLALGTKVALVTGQSFREMKNLKSGKNKSEIFDNFILPLIHYIDANHVDRAIMQNLFVFGSSGADAWKVKLDEDQKIDYDEIPLGINSVKKLDKDRFLQELKSILSDSGPNVEILDRHYVIMVHKVQNDILGKINLIQQKIHEMNLPFEVKKRGKRTIEISYQGVSKSLASNYLLGLYPDLDPSDILVMGNNMAGSDKEMIIQGARVIALDKDRVEAVGIESPSKRGIPGALEMLKNINKPSVLQAIHRRAEGEERTTMASGDGSKRKNKVYLLNLNLAA